MAYLTGPDLGLGDCIVPPFPDSGPGRLVRVEPSLYISHLQVAPFDWARLSFFRNVAHFSPDFDPARRYICSAQLFERFRDVDGLVHVIERNARRVVGLDADRQHETRRAARCEMS